MIALRNIAATLQGTCTTLSCIGTRVTKGNLLCRGIELDSATYGTPSNIWCADAMRWISARLGRCGNGSQLSAG
jgi:hypothetical protein